MFKDKTTGEIVRGTLEMMILRTLVVEERHGYDITRHIQLQSGGVLNVEEGSLYPALHRLEKKGMVSSRWERSENNRRAKFYTLTEDGKQHLKQKTSSWARASAAVNLVLDGGPEPGVS